MPMTPIRTDVSLQQSQTASQQPQQATDAAQQAADAALFTNLITTPQEGAKTGSSSASASPEANTLASNLAANQGLGQTLNASSTILANLANDPTGGGSMNKITNSGTSAATAAAMAQPSDNQPTGVVSQSTQPSGNQSLTGVTSQPTQPSDNQSLTGVTSQSTQPSGNQPLVGEVSQSTQKTTSDSDSKAVKTTDVTTTSQNIQPGDAILGALLHTINTSNIQPQQTTQATSSSADIATRIDQIAQQVAQQIMVSQPDLQGKQEVVIVLKNDVLPGTQIHVTRNDNNLSITFESSVTTSANLISQSQPSIQQALQTHLGETVTVQVHDTSAGAQSHNQQNMDGQANDNQGRSRQRRDLTDELQQ